MLLEKGADVNAMNKGGFTALHMASLMGHEDIVAILLEKGLEKGADVNAENKSGDTALILASKNGHPKIVKLINEYPKNQSEADKKNWDIVQKELREREGEDISPGKIVLGMTSEQGPSPRDFLGGKKNKKKTKKQRR
jgi:ankyrin repeat protein